MRVRTNVQRIAAVIALAAGIALTLVFLAPNTAVAGCGAGGGFGDTGDVWGSCTGQSPGEPPTSNQKALWEHYCINTPQAAEWGFEWVNVPGLPELKWVFVSVLSPSEYALYNYDPTGVYAWYTMGCITRFEDAAGEPFWDWIDNGAEVFESSPPIPIEDVLDRAKDRVDPPYPTLGAAPPLDNVIVKALTWLWLEDYPWDPIEETESQGAVTVYITATPQRVEWEMGDSGYVECSGPGVPWTVGADDADSDCHYTFADSSAILPTGVFSGSATVVFDVEWWMDDPWSTGRYMGGAGTIERVTTFDVDVDEVQSIETG